MKKLIVLLISLITLFCPSLNVLAYEDNTNAVIFLEATKDNEYVIVKANLMENEGIYSLNLTLDYDYSVFEFVKCDFKTALSSLDPMMTNNPKEGEPIVF